jgi:hypothetical protein
MLERFVKLLPFLDRIARDKHHIIGDRFLNDCEIVDVKELTEEFSGIQSVMLKLQAEYLKLYAARRYFDVSSLHNT